MYNYTLLYFEQKTYVVNRKVVYAWDAFKLDKDLPETWPDMDILPSFSQLPVPGDLKFLCREAFKPDAMTGKRPSTTRANNAPSEGAAFSEAVRTL